MTQTSVIQLAVRAMYTACVGHEIHHTWYAF